MTFLFETASFFWHLLSIMKKLCIVLSVLKAHTVYAIPGTSLINDHFLFTTRFVNFLNVFALNKLRGELGFK